MAVGKKAIRTDGGWMVYHIRIACHASTPEGTYIYDYFPLRLPKERLPTYEKRCAEAPLVKIAFACDKFFSTRTAPVETINDEMARGIQVATKTSERGRRQ